jgi:dUTPase
MGVQLIDTDFQGPLAKDTVGLLLSRSSSALKGLQITPGVIDPNYTGVMKILVASPVAFQLSPQEIELLNYYCCQVCINIFQQIIK